MKNNFTIWILLGSLLMTSRGWTAHPFVTEDAGTVPKGSTEMELTSEFKNKFTDFGYALTHGLTDHLDIAVGSGQCIAPKEEQEIHPLALGMKFAVVPGLFSFVVAAPLSTREHALTAIYSHVLNDHVHLHANLGYTAEHALSSLNLAYAWSGQFIWNALEAGLEINGGAKGLNGLQVGAAYTMGSLVRIDGGIGVSDESHKNWTGMFGMTFYLAGFTRKE